MIPLLTWTWPDSAAEIAAVLAVTLVLRFVLRRAIRTGVRTSLAVADRHRASMSDAEGTTSRNERVLGKLTGAVDARHQARVRTTGSVLTNAVDVVLVVLMTLTILRVLGVPLEPVLAASGIGGVALAFGAQSLVKDYISGILMIFEDQFGVGDLIDTGEVIGTVEAVGLRVTRLRDGGGQVWYVRNGEIQRVGNQSQGWSTAIVDVPIAASEDPARALDILREVTAEVFADEQYADVLLEEPAVAGVNEISVGSIILRILAKTAPNQQWGVQRDLLARSLEALHAAGVKDPLPPAAAPPATS
ncbi:MAG: mechanosensitive ion channel family protein [Propioniciclava sp.]|uniref:mechanosensitive ion channel family protein n=1 Tax=Propioniciclava sp. TaxID=2038686 RepID=UPI0039E71204